MLQSLQNFVRGFKVDFHRYTLCSVHFFILSCPIVSHIMTLCNARQHGSAFASLRVRMSRAYLLVFALPNSHSKRKNHRPASLNGCTVCMMAKTVPTVKPIPFVMCSEARAQEMTNVLIVSNKNMLRTSRNFRKSLRSSPRRKDTRHSRVTPLPSWQNKKDSRNKRKPFPILPDLPRPTVDAVSKPAKTAKL